MYGLGNTSDSMILGSPVSANSPVHQPQFLPGYLLGDSSFSGGASPMAPQRVWTPSGGHSPPKSTSRLMSPSSHNRSGMLLTPRSEHRPAGRDYSHRTKDKSGAPPVLGLLDQITSPVPVHSPLQTYHRHQNFDTSLSGPPHVGGMDYEASYSQQQTPQQPVTRSEVPSAGLFSPQSDMSMMRSGRLTPPSPPQVDPFYTQGEEIGPDDRLDETWVTVFGFSAAAASFILQQFSQYGNIVQHVVAPEGNWMHLRYQSKIQAKKALSKNGKIFGNGIMVGVQPCIDKKILKQNSDSLHNMSSTVGSSFVNSPYSTMPVQQIGAHDTSIRRLGTPNMRPLTSAYRSVATENDVLNKTSTPQKSTSVIGKALEYMFGW